MTCCLGCALIKLSQSSGEHWISFTVNLQVSRQPHKYNYEMFICLHNNIFLICLPHESISSSSCQIGWL